MDAKPMKNHGWPTISLIKYGIISCWFYLEKYNTWNVDAILQGYTSYFFNMNFYNILTILIFKLNPIQWHINLLTH